MQRMQLQQEQAIGNPTLLFFSSSIACKKRSKLPSWKLCKAGIRMGAPLARCDL